MKRTVRDIIVWRPKSQNVGVLYNFRENLDGDSSPESRNKQNYSSELQMTK